MKVMLSTAENYFVNSLSFTLSATDEYLDKSTITTPLMPDNYLHWSLSTFQFRCLIDILELPRLQIKTTFFQPRINAFNAFELPCYLWRLLQHRLITTTTKYYEHIVIRPQQLHRQVGTTTTTLSSGKTNYQITTPFFFQLPFPLRPSPGRPTPL